jgi:hypothetical protein
LRLKASPGKKSARACLRTKLNNLQLFWGLEAEAGSRQKLETFSQRN